MDSVPGLITKSVRACFACGLTWMGSPREECPRCELRATREHEQFLAEHNASMMETLEDARRHFADEAARYQARIKELIEQSNYLYGLGQEYDRLLADCRQAYLRLEAYCGTLQRSFPTDGWRSSRGIIPRSQAEAELADWQRERLET